MLLVPQLLSIILFISTLQSVHLSTQVLFYDHYQGNVSSLLNTKISVKESLPNISGNAPTLWNSNQWTSFGTGAFSSIFGQYKNHTTSGNSYWVDGLHNFSASRVSSVYQDGAGVHPLSNSCLFLIKYA